MGNSRRTALLAAAAVALAPSISLVYANVFVYYPIQASLSPVNRPIYFDTSATNAGNPDIGGGGNPYQTNKIEAVVSDGNTRLDITVHPTHRVTYYKNVAKILNTDGKTYYVYIKVESVTNNLPSNSEA